MVHWPSTIKPIKLVSSARLMKALTWDPASGTRFRVLDRKRGGRGLVATFRCAGNEAGALAGRTDAHHGYIQHVVWNNLQCAGTFAHEAAFM